MTLPQDTPTINKTAQSQIGIHEQVEQQIISSPLTSSPEGLPTGDLFIQDSLEGGNEPDIIEGSISDDNIDGENGDDRIQVNGGDDTAVICYHVLMERIYFLVVTEQITLAVVAELILLQISVPYKGMLNQTRA